MAETLSAYELERLANIKRNNQKLVELGLEKPLIPQKRGAATKKRAPKKDEDPDYAPPTKRITRVSGGGRVSKSAAYKEDASEDDSSDDDEYEEPRRPTKISSKKAASKAETTAPPADVGDGEECVVVEAAKTGRSKCRKCFEMLEQGELRVGMQSWMVGRQVMVWQHPRCFWEGLAITEEPTGRGKCKATKEGFRAGERRLSAQAHTTTNHFKASCAFRTVLDRVMQADRDACVISAIPGFGGLSEEEQAMLTGASAAPAPPSVPTVDETPATAEPEAKAKAVGTVADETRQPPKGQISKAKGKVCWRFAGHLCYGSLLPAQESKTHCYARTHKGNTKTLTKGGTSWWMLDE